MGQESAATGLRVERGDGILTLRHRWFGRGIVVHLLGFGCAAFLLYSMGLGRVPASKVLLNPFGVILSAMGLVCGVMIVYALVERSVVRVRGGTLTVAHGPLPWPGARKLEVADLVGVFVQRHDYGRGGSKKAQSTDWSVDAETRSLGKITLVNGPLTPAVCGAIVAALNAELRLEPRKADL